VHKGSNSSRIATTGDHHHAAKLELDNIRHFARGNVDLDGVVHLDIGVGVAKSPSVMGDGNGDLVIGNVNLIDTAELVLGLLTVDAVQDKASFCVEQETEAIATLLELNDVHESGREIVVGSDLSVNLDTPFHTDLHALLIGEGILQPLSEHDANGEALTQFVWSLGRPGGKHTAHFAQIPMLGGIEPLKVLLRSASPATKTN
jgi:hypothetical protein